MIRMIVISALILGTSVCQAVTIGAQQSDAPRSEHRVVQKNAPKKVIKRTTIKRKKAAPINETVKVKHHHHHYHHYHHPRQERYVERVVVRRPGCHRQVYYHPYRQPVRVTQSRVFYPAQPMSGAGLHFVLR
ncbi:MAG: hypothetical protein AB7I18_01180 [Candidatus Berkiella sp.]